MPCKKNKEALRLSWKRRVVKPSRFQWQNMHASWRLTSPRDNVWKPSRFQWQNMHASWRLTSPRDNVWNHLHRKIMMITSQAKEKSMTHYNLVHKFIPAPQAMKIPDAKAAVDKEWKKLETMPVWLLDKAKEPKGGYCGSTTRQKRKSALLHWWTYVTSRTRS